ncbi:N-acetylglucosaminyldiphosphoundecaprenol N-acetyl-beta-D-mannosaminyltransferase [Rubritalea squalenifaciens DSM 18772]|uniref:N-acetylglucosaminyldiphosphoundecaprenol N-acetyl-beta-D-mannosaminyltransferase n=1 Tax=Rubritalea squalenifaciens DSM 18772 TaxID=1123071 RepID=A0A1M6DG35_9BACT|nr:WecB/TagA/CpsF family glycosyltransferase [Rubritalea squalenifaciens]SHI72307.1 N-acetylglucosaminyldiphosphoundecaprenol N-acetyl-beta-D-mannosaminyltransferase [Rubritalea squalenifaciens DSM 18772]
MKTIDVIGLPIAITDYGRAVAWTCEHAIRGDRAYAVEAANTHVAALSRHNKQFGEVMAKFDLVCPDGMPLVWSVNRRLDPQERLTDRVYGPTLMLEVIKASERNQKIKHFLLGGAQSTLDSLAERFQTDYPDAKIAGSYSPPFGEWPADEFERISRKIQESGANVVWVGLGCPKQEKWIAQYKEQLPPAVYFGIGAAFAFHAGEVSQAPPWIQKMGCEWAYRLCKEPRRLFKRYFTYNSLFIYYSLTD